MPHPEEVADSGGETLRCRRCGAGVRGTCHTRTGYTVGYYVLHTGRTVEAVARRADDEAVLFYRRLVEPLEVVTCPACFVTPAVQGLWQRFGDEEESAVAEDVR
jgi:hypothetical protein